MKKLKLFKVTCVSRYHPFEGTRSFTVRGESKAALRKMAIHHHVLHTDEYKIKSIEEIKDF